MAFAGTEAHDSPAGLPPRVAAAVAAARRAGFTASCLPQQRHLLRLLAGGVGTYVGGQEPKGRSE